MLARVLAENHGRVVALEQLCEELCARTDDAARRAVKQHAHMLRKKCDLAAGPTAQRLRVEAVYGKGYRLTLVVDLWIDPIVPEDAAENPSTFLVGRLIGTALLYDYGEARVVCAGRVEAQNDDVTLVRDSDMLTLRPRSDDPLSLVRVDLAVQGLRAAVPALRAVEF